MSIEQVLSVELPVALRTAAPEVPDNWDYANSVKRTQILKRDYARVSAAMLELLWVAREALSRPGRPETGTHDPVLTWDGYCQECGLNRRTVNRWLERWSSSWAPEIPANAEPVLTATEQKREAAREAAADAVAEEPPDGLGESMDDEREYIALTSHRPSANSDEVLVPEVVAPRPPPVFTEPDPVQPTPEPVPIDPRTLSPEGVWQLISDKVHGVPALMRGMEPGEAHQVRVALAVELHDLAELWYDKLTGES